MGLDPSPAFVEQRLLGSRKRALGARSQRAEVQQGSGEPAADTQRRRRARPQPLSKQLRSHTQLEPLPRLALAAQLQLQLGLAAKQSFGALEFAPLRGLELGEFGARHALDVRERGALGQAALALVVRSGALRLRSRQLLGFRSSTRGFCLLPSLPLLVRA